MYVLTLIVHVLEIMSILALIVHGTFRDRVHVDIEVHGLEIMSVLTVIIYGLEIVSVLTLIIMVQRWCPC